MSEAKKADIIQRQKRRVRVQRLKIIIILCLVMVILLPTILCVILFIKLNKVENQIENLEARQREHLLAESYVLEETLADTEQAPDVQGVFEEIGSGDIGKEPIVSEHKIHVYLTFDDGPSNNTDEILDILNQYQVKATFFVVGKSEEYAPVYKRIVEEGHTIGMHSYSHKYSEIYQDLDSFSQDMEKLQNLIYDKTGVVSTIYRFPGGSSNTVSEVDMEELIAYLDEQGITYYDWNVSSLDATGESLSVNDIVENVAGNIQFYNNAIVLMHDANDKITTVEALPIIIERLLAMGNVEILPIKEETVKIQHTTLQEE